MHPACLDSLMSSYQVFFVCPACKKKHRAPVHVELARGPAEEESVEEVFGDRPRPPEVDNLTNTRFLCPRTDEFVQPGEKDLTLVREESGRPRKAKRAPAKKSARSAKKPKR
jgi:hypothetical protein